MRNRKVKKKESEQNTAKKEYHETTESISKQNLMRMFIDAVSNIEIFTKENLREYTLRKYNRDIWADIVDMGVITRSAVRGAETLQNLPNSIEDLRQKRKVTVMLDEEKGDEKDIVETKITRNSLVDFKVKKQRTILGNVETVPENREVKTLIVAKSSVPEAEIKYSGATEDTLATKPVKQNEMNQTADESIAENKEEKPSVEEKSKATESRKPRIDNENFDDKTS